MRFYSDMLEKFFNTEEECLAAERITLDTSKEAIQRANDELELKTLRKKVTDLRIDLENTLAEYYRLQNKYFDNYGSLCDMTEEEGHPDPVGEKGDVGHKGCEHDCCGNCSCGNDCGFDPVEGVKPNDDDFTPAPITIHMSTYRPLKDSYPNLWKFFGGK